MPGIDNYIDPPQLEERVRAACGMIDKNDIAFRRLETRSREQYDPRSSWMVPLKGGTSRVFAVELVPCEPDDEGAVELTRNDPEETRRTNARVLYDLWIENVPADELP